MPYTAQCHCGNITVIFDAPVNALTSCNCSICHKLGALWGYTHPSNITVKAVAENTTSYSHGDKYIEFHHCPRCGCTTHYTPTKIGNPQRMAVNFKMVSKKLINDVKIRHFDGADTWKFIEN
ncbi:GFA family protein [Pseudoalteromonas sp. MSK9-3]|uniref:GFA family protein n=1 Tax=Pseudoalteromonas sp. MSK9-3 TaxID=1897633 RepID=UPI000E6BF9AA|nr:aldehyde-activating protein [Pseudoalteromonas sp. MSK9-3]